MLVKEIREELKKYNKEQMTDIIVELYKRIPKTKKEEYGIDEFIKNPVKIEKKENKLSFEELKQEIVYFLQCVDAEYYAVPNKVVPKKERSKWRFKVKRYYKELNQIAPNEPNGGIATMLLIELFKRLSHGSNYLLFIIY